MQFETIAIPGVRLILPTVFGDDRGFFFESLRASLFAEAGIKKPFVQDNVSRSAKDVLRGLHHQVDHTQGKLIQVIRGKIFDVAVDIRRGSPTFGQWAGQLLDDESHALFYLPPGIAHGFCVLSDVADICYKCTDYYHPASELSIAWDDPDLGINWPTNTPKLSDKDKAGVRLSTLSDSQLPVYQA